MRWNPLRRMRDAAYEQGYQNGVSKGFADGCKAARRLPGGGSLKPSWARIEPEQGVRVAHDAEDPFLVSDWREMHPTPGRPTCSHGHEAGSAVHVCAELPSAYGR